MPRVRLDYSTRRYTNPLFQKRLKAARSPSLLKKIIGLVVIFAVIVVGVWFFVYSAIFRVSEVAISGTQRLSADEVRAAVQDAMKEARWKIVPGDNLLFLSESDLSAKLIDKFVLESAEVTKRPPKGLEISVKERVSSILFAMPDGSRALLDLGGAVIHAYAPNDVIPADISTTHQLIDDKDETVEAKEHVMDPEAIQDVIDAPGMVHDVWNGAQTLAAIHVEGKRSHTLRLVTGEGWSIYIDIQQPLRPQLENAELVVRTKVGNDRPKLDYVDVRFNEKVFFKLK